jgi:DNA helicase-2/ATP-dependent DNA helicase PcrA
MRDRLKDVHAATSRAFIGTIHSFCIQILADRGGPVGVEGLPNIFNSASDRKQLLHEAIQSDPILRDELAAIGDTKDQSKRLDEWIRLIGEVKAKPISQPYSDNETVQRLVDVYNNALKSCGAIDFEDSLLLTLSLFETRPKIADFYRRLYRFICVDEAQDLNEAQYAVLCALCGESYRNVMMVGDPRQSIFGFNTSDPKFMDQFRVDFSAEVFYLSENFRSSREVVKIAQALDKNYKVEGQLPVKGEVRLFVAKDEDEEAAFVASKIKSLIASGHPDVEGNLDFSRIAILGRTRFVLLRVTEALKANSIPFYRSLSISIEVESKLFVELDLLLRVSCNPQDRLHLTRLLQSWNVSLANDIPRGIDRDELLAILSDSAPSAMSRVVTQAASTACSSKVFNLRPALDLISLFASDLDDTARIPILNDVAVWSTEWDLFLRSEAGSSRSLPAFLAAMALGTNQQPRQDGVALLTVHSSKGLEFDTVFIIGMADGVFPDFRAKNKPREYQEERRNLFVGATRSRRLLFFTYPRTRVMPWGDVWAGHPSAFLSELRLAAEPVA